MIVSSSRRFESLVESAMVALVNSVDCDAISGSGSGAVVKLRHLSTGYQET